MVRFDDVELRRDSDRGPWIVEFTDLGGRTIDRRVLSADDANAALGGELVQGNPYQHRSEADLDERRREHAMRIARRRRLEAATLPRSPMRMVVISIAHLREALAQGEYDLNAWGCEPAAVRAVVSTDELAAVRASVWVYAGPVGGSGAVIDWIGPRPEVP